MTRVIIAPVCLELVACHVCSVSVGLTRKASLFEVAQRAKREGRNPMFTNSVPLTLIISDHESLEAAIHALDTSHCRWVLKLSECNRGRGLHTLSPGQGERLRNLCQSGGPWVCAHALAC